MSAQSQQIRENFLKHPYTQQANKFLSGQVQSLDAEVSRPWVLLLAVQG
jgi:receptor expression-enhancing protein 5/6